MSQRTAQELRSTVKALQEQSIALKSEMITFQQSSRAAERDLETEYHGISERREEYLNTVADLATDAFIATRSEYDISSDRLKRAQKLLDSTERLDGATLRICNAKIAFIELQSLPPVVFNALHRSIVRKLSDPELKEYRLSQSKFHERANLLGEAEDELEDATDDLSKVDTERSTDLKSFNELTL